MRLVFDTNVLVSAVIARGVSRELFDLWRVQRGFELVVCPQLIDELSEVLRRARFRQAIHPDEVDVLLSLLRSEADVVHDPVDVSRVTADPDDDYLVALALREHADMLVSGDRHLTEADAPVLVLTPSEALHRLRH